MAWRMNFILVNGKVLSSFKISLMRSDLCFKTTQLLCGKDGEVVRGGNGEAHSRGFCRGCDVRWQLSRPGHQRWGRRESDGFELSFEDRINRGWWTLRGLCPCKQDPIKSRGEEDRHWNQTDTYLSAGSAMHLPGHLRKTTWSFAGSVSVMSQGPWPILPKLLSVHSLSSCWDSNSTLVLRGPDMGSRGQPRRLQIVLQEGRNNVGFRDQEFETEGRNTLY